MYLKAATILILVFDFTISLYFSVCLGLDISGEVRNATYATVVEAEEMVLTGQDDLAELQEKKKKMNRVEIESPMSGYDLYYRIMVYIGTWYDQGTFQILKILILTCSLLNTVASFTALLTVLFHRRLCSCWCCHPVPLILVEGGFTASTVLILTMSILCLKERTALLLIDVVCMMMSMVIIFFFSGIVSSFYREEKERLDKILKEELEKEALESDINEILDVFPGVEENLVRELLEDTGSTHTTVQILDQMEEGRQEEGVEASLKQEEVQGDSLRKEENTLRKEDGANQHHAKSQRKVSTE